jgi:hypothetical protein
MATLQLSPTATLETDSPHLHRPPTTTNIIGKQHNAKWLIANSNCFTQLIDTMDIFTFPRSHFFNRLVDLPARSS